MAKSADPDQLASSDLDLHCLQRQGISGFSRTKPFDKTKIMKFKQHSVNFDSAETEEIQSNIKSSNTDGSFTMANLNMFFGSV